MKKIPGLKGRLFAFDGVHLEYLILDNRHEIYDSYLDGLVLNIGGDNDYDVNALIREYVLELGYGPLYRVLYDTHSVICAPGDSYGNLATCILALKR